MIEVATDMKHTHRLKKIDTEFTFLPSGDVCQANVNGVMLNQVIGNTLDGSMNNLFLRIHQNDVVIHTPMLGIQSDSVFHVNDESVKWTGEFHEVSYTVTFQLGELNSWYWTIDVEAAGETVDIVYGWDLGLNYQGALQSNEGYVAQYVGHSVFEGENGYVVCSRQNQSEEDFPYVQQGGLTKTVGYSTDGFQFFGKSYKETDEIEQLSKSSLANKVYQYEFDYTALQTEKVELSGSHQFIYYGLYKANHPEAVTELEFTEDIKKDYQNLTHLTDFTAIEKVSLSQSIGQPMASESLTQAELDDLYPNRIQEEKNGDIMHSFFTEDYSHVALKEKEVELERQHGHIVYTRNELTTDTPVMATTSWMTGVFNSQVVLGNTNMNKFMTNTRNHLNVLKAQGQRIYIKTDDQYHLLTMPSLFEMGFNYVRWIYKTEMDTFTVTNFTHSQSDTIKLKVESSSGKAYAYKVTTQVVLNDGEYAVPFNYSQRDNLLTFKPGNESFINTAYPELTYHMQIEGPSITCSDGSSLLEKSAGSTASMIVLDVPETDTFLLTMQGSIEGKDYESLDLSLEEEKEKFKAFYASTMKHLKLTHKDAAAGSEVEKMNLTLWWYTHDMFVHYLSPHGLEQYGGAAWGTRDVAQGPAEYFMAMKQYDIVKAIILKLFTHQFKEDGNWPQWFMFDKYVTIHSDESHGDIIVWPMKLLADYLKATEDFAILKEEVSYLSRETKLLTEEKESLFSHLKKEVDYISMHFLEGTSLSSYDDGDWDDTLQPFNEKLKKFMASTWTVALTYQSLSTLSSVMGSVDTDFQKELDQLTDSIQSDYESIIMSSEVIPGFIYMENGETDFMIHPSDTKTGITYRLLPMIRSMISELFDAEQVETHLDIIKKELTFNDGIRLMNRPAEYKGGVSSNFKRAEQAANFGREIGLLYVHAHIRYIEAMAKIGIVDETWDNLLKINPINIKDHVPNAQVRQNNAYFSSSDAAFDDRYEAQENYDKLRKGEVEVKGGWRVYSSGPGIYLNQLISNVLGLREVGEDLIFDPVLPEKLNGLELSSELFGKPLTVQFNTSSKFKVTAIELNGNKLQVKELSNKYRSTGLQVNKTELDKYLTDDNNKLVIK